MTVTDRVLKVLVDVSEIEELQHEPDVRLYDLQILDSMKTVELIVAFSSEFGVEISPAEFDREEWATPRKIISYIERKLVA
jgi:D-alanine--poly(phosphoribitol) ligase subunit 2